MEAYRNSDKIAISVGDNARRKRDNARHYYVIIGHYLSALVHITEHPLDKNSQHTLMPVSIANAHFLGISGLAMGISELAIGISV